VETVKQVEAQLKKEQAADGTKQAVDELVARAQKRLPTMTKSKSVYKTTAPQLVEFLKTRGVSKGHYQERNSPILVRNVIELHGPERGRKEAPGGDGAAFCGGPAGSGG
jgi:hypothetical protein